MPCLKVSRLEFWPSMSHAMDIVVQMAIPILIDQREFLLLLGLEPSLND